MARMYWHINIDELAEAYADGVPLAELCERYQIAEHKLYELRKAFGIPARPRATPMSDAPNDEEERHSAASLALSPWVESRIKELREAKVLAEQRAEYEIAQVRMFRHHCSRV